MSSVGCLAWVSKTAGSYVQVKLIDERAVYTGDPENESRVSGMQNDRNIIDVIEI